MDVNIYYMTSVIKKLMLYIKKYTKKKEAKNAQTIGFG